MESSIQNEVEEKRTRKKTSLDPTVCPVCSCSIRENELQNHFKMELEKLGKIKKISTNRSPSSTSPSTSKGKSSEASTSTEIDTWSTFQRIKENRVRRTSRVKFLIYFHFVRLELIVISFLAEKSQKESRRSSLSCLFQNRHRRSATSR